MAGWAVNALGVPVSYVISNPSSYAYPTDERPTPGAWPLTANAPGYILDVDEDAPLFRSLGDGNGCIEYDPWAALEVLVRAEALSNHRTRKVAGASRPCNGVRFPLTSDPGGPKLRP